MLPLTLYSTLIWTPGGEGRRGVEEGREGRGGGHPAAYKSVCVWAPVSQKPNLEEKKKFNKGDPILAHVVFSIRHLGYDKKEAVNCTKRTTL